MLTFIFQIKLSSFIDLSQKKKKLCDVTGGDLSKWKKNYLASDLYKKSRKWERVVLKKKGLIPLLQKLQTKTQLPFTLRFMGCGTFTEYYYK